MAGKEVKVKGKQVGEEDQMEADMRESGIIV